MVAAIVVTQATIGATVREMAVGTTAQLAKAGISPERPQTLARRRELIRLRRVVIGNQWLHIGEGPARL